MGEVRHKEMLNVEKTLGLRGMTVLNMTDSGLKEMDPREIEKAVREEIEKVKPNVIVTYAVHGISGFHDHLVSHAVVKNVFVDMKEKADYLKRLALFTVNEEAANEQKHFKLNFSKDEEIDCIIETSNEDVQKGLGALECYETYKETIKDSNIAEFLKKSMVFEIYREKHEPKLKDLFEKL
jgi:LmbE family N-acetylglucosaminyl deacetylase